MDHMPGSVIVMSEGNQLHSEHLKTTFISGESTQLNIKRLKKSMFVLGLKYANKIGSNNN